MSIVSALLWSLGAVFFWGNTVRVFFARGTQLRYVVTSIVWTLCPTPPLVVILDTITRSSHWAFWLGFTAVCWPLHMWMLLHDDDDNWFRRMRRRIKGWLRSQQRRLLVPVGVS